jgi:response regulator NasT
MRMSLSDNTGDKNYNSANANVAGAAAHVLLIEDDEHKDSILKKTLLEFGFHISQHVSLETDIMKQIHTLQPNMLILATDLPSAKMLKTLAEINQLLPLPIIIFAENDSPNLIKSAIKAGVSAYVVSEIMPQRLNSIISVANERFKAEQSLRDELKRAKDQLESRKYIEKAKGIIMEQKSLNEQESYSLLRKMAMDQGNSLAEVAKNIIDVHALLSNA